MRPAALSLLSLLSLLVLAVPSPASAQDCPPQYAVCLTPEEKEQVVRAVRELKDVRDSKAELEFRDPIVVIRDWDDRVYVNGGRTKPLRLKLRIGSTVDRDMEATVPVRVFYREKPPDPPLRLRIRAQAGFLLPSVVDSAKDDGGVYRSVDAGVGWDFLHLGDWNLSAHTGIRSVGGGIGLDLTRNFGPYAGYSLVYDGLRSNALLGCYFSFN